MACWTDYANGFEWTEQHQYWRNNIGVIVAEIAQQVKGRGGVVQTEIATPLHFV